MAAQKRTARNQIGNENEGKLDSGNLRRKKNFTFIFLVMNP